MHSRPLQAWQQGGSSLPGSVLNNLALPASVITAFDANLHSQVRTGPENTLLSMHQSLNLIAVGLLSYFLFPGGRRGQVGIAGDVDTGDKFAMFPFLLRNLGWFG